MPEQQEFWSSSLPASIDTISCPVCGLQTRFITTQHIRNHGYATAKEFKEKYGLRYLKSDAARLKHSQHMSNDNPSKGHSPATRAKICANRRGKGMGVSGKYERTPEIKAKISVGVVNAYLAGRFDRHRWPREEVDGIDCFDKAFVSRSTWEVRTAVVLGRHPCVLDAKYEPFGIPYEFDGVKRSYLPDFLIKLEGNITELWEVKPQSLLSMPKNVAKLAGLRAYAKARGWNTRIVTLKDIEGMEMQVGIRPWVGPGGPWVSESKPHQRPTKEYHEWCRGERNDSPF